MATGKNKAASRAEQLAAGIQKHFGTGGSLVVAGTPLTPAEVLASMQTLADLRAAVSDAKAALQAKVAAEEAQAPALRRRMTAFVAYVRATLGNAPDVLADFGLKPTKTPEPLTVAQRTEAVARAKATRAARHTMGPQQKKAVKGTVTTIVSSAPETAPHAS
jgi:hypothetical protein